MRTTVALDPRQVPAHLRGDYKGKSFEAVVADKVTVPMTAGLWDGGSRTTFTLVRIADGAEVPFPGQELAPWDRRGGDKIVDLRPGFLMREHNFFQGRDMGLVFHMHAADVAPMLPAPGPELTKVQGKVLELIGGLIPRARREEALRAGISCTTYDQTVEELKALNLLNKAGALTIAGKNVLNAKGVI